MDWDCKFYIRKNNLFQRQWSSSEPEDQRVLTVTEVNRGLPCAACQKSVGEVGNAFFEIDQKPYCYKCGSEMTQVKEKAGSCEKAETGVATTF